MSQDFRVGAFGNTKLSAYRREVQGQTAVQGTVAQAAASQSTVNTGAPLRVTIPPRPGRTPAGLNTAGQSGLTRGTPVQSAVTQGTVGQSMVAQTAAPQNTANTGAPLRVTIPPRPGRTPAAGSTVQNAGVQSGNVRPGNVQPGSAGTGGMQQRNQGMQSPAGGNTRTRTERTPVMPTVSGGAPAEKSFEELAQLASSIVMIAVQDDTGKVRGTGSGIMIGTEGFILTNFHVVCGGRAFAVRIEDDEQIYTTDEIIKYNTTMDLAVIRIQRKLKPLRIFKGERKLVRGQKVVAIGSPLGLFNSVSDGIISGFRQIHDTDMIQFTAPTSPGSSGGAVLNMQGEVIGISSAGFDDGQNINLAVGYESIRMFARGFYKE